MSNGFVVDFVDVLQNGKSADFTDDSSEESINVLGIVADEEELVAKLGKVGLDALAHLSEHDRERLGVLLVGSRRGFKRDVGRLEKVELNLSAEVSFVTNDAAVVILHFHIVQIVDVVDIGRRDVVGVEDPTHAGQSVEFVAVVILPLRGAIAVRWGAVDVVPTHGASFGTGGLADLDGLRVDDEAVLASVNAVNDSLAYLLAKTSRQLAAVVVLPPGDKIRDLVFGVG